MSFLILTFGFDQYSENRFEQLVLVVMPVVMTVTVQVPKLPHPRLLHYLYCRGSTVASNSTTASAMLGELNQNRMYLLM